MRTENLVNVIRTAQSMSADWEVFNQTNEIKVRESAFLNWASKHTMEFEDVDKELPLYGSYLVAYEMNESSAIAFQNEMNKMLDKEIYSYVTWLIKNQAKGTAYKYIVIVQVGVFLEENI